MFRAPCSRAVSYGERGIAPARRRHNIILDSNDIFQINRLIYLSLAHSNGRKQLVGRHQDEARELIQRYQADLSFQGQVHEGLSALELQVLDVEALALRISALHAGSFFAANLTEYGKVLARNELKAAELLMVHCAVATAFFPSEADLDAPVEDLGIVMVEDVVEVLRRFATAEKSLDEDDDLLHPEVRTAAQRFRELPEENPDSRRAGGGHSWVELIQRVFEHMVETGYLLAFEDRPGELEYRPTPAYQAALKCATVYAFHAFRDVVETQEMMADQADGEA